MKGFQYKTAYLTSNVFYVSPGWSTGRFMAVLWVVLKPVFLYINLYIETETVYSTTHKTAINRPVDQTGET